MKILLKFALLWELVCFSGIAVSGQADLTLDERLDDLRWELLGIVANWENDPVLGGTFTAKLEGLVDDVLSEHYQYLYGGGLAEENISEVENKVRRIIRYAVTNFRIQVKADVLFAGAVSSENVDILETRTTLGKIQGFKLDIEECFDFGDSFLTDFSEKINPDANVTLKKKPQLPTILHYAAHVVKDPNLVTILLNLEANPRLKYNSTNLVYDVLCKKRSNEKMEGSILKVFTDYFSENPEHLYTIYGRDISQVSDSMFKHKANEYAAMTDYMFALY